MRAFVKIGLVALVAVAGAVGIGTYRISCPIEPMRRARVAADIRELAKRLEAYKVSHGNYPAELQSLLEHNQLKEIPHDPWQHEYIYRRPGVKNPRGFDLLSAGRDRIPDTADDDWGDF